jgi:hypothetical protein
MSSGQFRNFAKRSEFVNIIKDFQREIQKRVRIENPIELTFKHYFRHNVDRILWFTEATNETNAVVTNPNLKYYQMPEEPNGTTLRIWLRFNDVAGTTAKDWSGFKNDAIIVGNPTRQSGHVVNMDAMSFDGIGNDHIRIPHKFPDTTMDALTEGFGISVWVFPTRIDLHGGLPRVIACKIDDNFTTRGRAWSLWVEPNGTLVFAVKEGSTVYVRRATQALKVMNIWYHITAFFDTTPDRLITPLHVNSIEYTGDVQTFNDAQPYLATISSTNLDTLIGGTDAVDTQKWAGAIGDFRYFRDFVYTHAHALIQYANKYTISDIVNVALIGVATTAFEAEGQAPPGAGETPPPPPAPSTTPSFSSISFSPDSFNTEKSAIIGGGGGGGAATTIPDQFYDDFNLDPVYAISTSGATTPDGKWNLRNAPTGTNSVIGTQDYTHSGDRARRILRMRANSANTYSPILTLNTARFNDIYMKCLLRVISQTSNASSSNTARIIFKYTDTSNFYYVALRPEGVQMLKVIAGTTTTLATQTNSSGTILYPIGSLHEVTIETRADGMEIYVWVDGSLVISLVQSNYNPPDTVINALNGAGFSAQLSDITVDHVLMRPILGDTFQGATYTMNTVGAKSTNNKWETITLGNGTGATIRTYDQSAHGTGGRVLNLNSGTGATTQPLVLSTNSYRGLDAAVRMGTLTVHTAAEGNRAQFIFKYVDANNYYWIQLVTNGWRIRRRVGGVEELIQTGTSPTFADNPAYPFHLVRVQSYNAGRDFVLRLGNAGTIAYEEHWQADGFYTQDNGLLAASGKIGFRAPLCNAVYDNFWCRMV